MGMFKTSKPGLSYFVAGAVFGVVAIQLLTILAEGDQTRPNVEEVKNAQRIEQNEKCLSNHMLPELVDGLIICTPDNGKIRLRQYFDYLEAERVIREKTGKPLPKKFNPDEEESFEPQKKVKPSGATYPVNPNSFETKHKVTL